MMPVTDCLICCVQEGKSALHLAAEQNRKDIADILLFNKAFVNAKTKLALTPLHLSAQNGSHNLIQPLIKIYQACTDALSLVSAQHYTPPSVLNDVL